MLTHSQSGLPPKALYLINIVLPESHPRHKAALNNNNLLRDWACAKLYTYDITLSVLTMVVCGYCPVKGDIRNLDHIFLNNSQGQIITSTETSLLIYYTNQSTPHVSSELGPAYHLALLPQ